MRWRAPASCQRARRGVFGHTPRPASPTRRLPLIGLAIIAPAIRRAAVHKPARAGKLRSHVALTLNHDHFSGGAPRRVIGGYCRAAAQAVFEFGPLWLVALAAPAPLYGSYWAALVSTLGVGGLLISKLNLERRLMVACGVLCCPGAAADLDPVATGLVAAQVVLGWPGDHRSPRQPVLHDGALLDPAGFLGCRNTDLGTVLPFSLVFGWTARENGMDWSGFMLAGAVVVVAVLLVLSVRASRGVVPVEAAATAKEEAVQVQSGRRNSVQATRRTGRRLP